MRLPLLAASLLLGGCFVPQVSLDGKGCDDNHPCIAGYTCVAGTCAHDGAASAGGTGGTSGTVGGTSSTGSSGGTGGTGGACANGRQDPGEADIDCGGPCLPCPDCRVCTRSADCASGSCYQGRCQQAPVRAELADGGASYTYQGSAGLLLAHYGKGTRMNSFMPSQARIATPTGPATASPAWTPTLCDQFGHLRYTDHAPGNHTLILECGPDREHVSRFAEAGLLPDFSGGTYGNYGAQGSPGWISFASDGDGNGRTTTGACGANQVHASGGIGFCSGPGQELADGGDDWGNHLASYAESSSGPGALDGPFLGCAGQGCSGPGCDLQVWVWLGP